eukprot:NODE_3502_length_966_cov_9.696838_g3215_i0.p1 GENE.NODE_3502_length_966_cov_9.696838_g3215_i0~~NODE_3502_length_966_cov_9.696838_g3215_i0.p1  ORF type:complete len:157 (+),score=6.36 NODE_3502_length_966_cov_9.696838_g3215_i0:190-660(+)
MLATWIDTSLKVYVFFKAHIQTLRTLTLDGFRQAHLPSSPSKTSGSNFFISTRSTWDSHAPCKLPHAWFAQRFSITRVPPLGTQLIASFSRVSSFLFYYLLYCFPLFSFLSQFFSLRFLLFCLGYLFLPIEDHILVRFFCVCLFCLLYLFSFSLCP